MKGGKKMVYYSFDSNDKALYQFARKYPNSIKWEDYASSKGRKVFPDCYSLQCPFFRGGIEHAFWSKYFNSYFGKKCTFPFIVRLINSFLITGKNKKNKN